MPSKKTNEKSSSSHSIFARVEILAAYNDVSLSTLERLCDIPKGTFAALKFRQKTSDKADVSSDILEKILTSYSTVNARWLITGEGNMLEQNAFLKVTNTDKALFTAMFTNLKERIRRLSIYLDELDEETTNITNAINHQ